MQSRLKSHSWATLFCSFSTGTCPSMVGVPHPDKWVSACLKLLTLWALSQVTHQGLVQDVLWCPNTIHPRCISPRWSLSRETRLSQDGIQSPCQRTHWSYARLSSTVKWSCGHCVYHRSRKWFSHPSPPSPAPPITSGNTTTCLQGAILGILTIWPSRCCIPIT